MIWPLKQQIHCLQINNIICGLNEFFLSNELKALLIWPNIRRATKQTLNDKTFPVILPKYFLKCLLYLYLFLFFLIFSSSVAAAF